jgi:hypothetical protein
MPDDEPSAEHGYVYPYPFDNWKIDRVDQGMSLDDHILTMALRMKLSSEAEIRRALARRGLEKPDEDIEEKLEEESPDYKRWTIIHDVSMISCPICAACFPVEALKIKNEEGRTPIEQHEHWHKTYACDWD